MQLNSNEPIVSFSVPMQQEDVHSWILEKAQALSKLALLKQRQTDLQNQLEKLDDEIFEQTELCRVTVAA
ncbi:hypothetical protein [Moellerella wisconsensis]|uniref:Uncharacterized protein n=1 Tax=Moellerella wisconsensis TaxID=158849 RepID=A0ACD3YBH6_9GAMM|nr:hypothetical protein [Moellerella wisconsensis]UNH40173.1 hypothetical protein MNY70_07005 [Moellerella wisconsensis]